MKWNAAKEPTSGADNFKYVNIVHILAGKSYCVSGRPGTGKIWMPKQIEEALGDVRKFAPTHAAELLLGGGTIHNFMAV